MTDYKQLCAELIDALDSGIPSARIRSSPLADQARDALAEPEPEEPTDEKWYSRFADWLEGEMPEGTVIGDPLWWASKIADYLARWGRPAVEPESEGPTDEDLDELFTEIDQSGESESWRPFARTVLARWGRAQPELEYPSDKELLELMPESMKNEFSYAAKLYSDATGGRVKPRIFRVGFNTAALEYAQAVLAHYSS